MSSTYYDDRFMSRYSYEYYKSTYVYQLMFITLLVMAFCEAHRYSTIDSNQSILITTNPSMYIRSYLHTSILLLPKHQCSVQTFTYYSTAHL